MGTLERVYQIDQLLANRQGVSRRELEARLGISWATLKRDLAYMKERLHAPIVFDRVMGGYRFAAPRQTIGPQYELPGLWFSAAEIHALLTMRHLLVNLDTGGLLEPHVQPLLSRLNGLLGTGDNTPAEIQRRVRLITVGARAFHLDHFQMVGSALLRRKRLILRYRARGTDTVTEREVSPQRLMYYRHNWYLDAWCHLRDDLRSFAVDAIQAAAMLDTRASDIDEGLLDSVLGSGYGIFSGIEVAWARLHFSPARARWVATERWHPQQEARMLEDGSYELRVPYADDREILMDILKYGGDCRVLGPQSLIDRVKAEFARGLAHY